MAILSISTLEAAEGVFDHYFPGELPPDRAYRLLEAILEAGVPPVPRPPTMPTLG